MLGVLIDFMIAVSTETNRVDVLENTQKSATAEAALNTAIANARTANSAATIKSAVEGFRVAANIAEEQAKAKRDEIINLLGRDLVDSFKPRTCIAPKIFPDYTVDYRPDPIRISVLSDEGPDAK